MAQLYARLIPHVLNTDPNMEMPLCTLLPVTPVPLPLKRPVKKAIGIWIAPC